MPTPVLPKDRVAITREQLTNPEELHRTTPGTASSINTVHQGRSTIRQILDGADDRIVVIVGPCSIHDHETALEYAGKLRDVANKLSDELFVVMRAYVEKPRTGLGWPGLTLVPDLHGPPDPEQGFRLARSVLADITDLGVPVATEWVNLVAPAYLADLVSWGCVGARSVEAQLYRQLASGLDMPVGMKNRTDGAVDVAVSAVQVAGRPQGFLGIAPDGSAALIRTAGNPDCHVVLRGGAAGPNHHRQAVTDTRRLLSAAGLPERLVIDASHGNCAKDHERQRVVAGEIGQQIEADTGIRGVMLESFLVAGRQEAVAGRPLTRGQSVTDACMSWPTTVSVLTELAGHVRRRRRTVPRPRTSQADATPAARAVALVRSGVFDSYMVYERAGVWTVAGFRRATVTLDAEHITVRHKDSDRRLPWRTRPLASLGEALAGLEIPQWTAYGWLTFETAHLLAGRRELAGNGILAHLVVPGAEVHIDDTGTRITCTDPKLRDRIRAALADPAPEPSHRPAAVDIDVSGEWYQQAVADAVREINDGTFRKVVLSRTVPVAAEIDFPGTYLAGRAANTPARSFLLDLGGWRATGFCPETVLEASGGVVSTQPLAGTRSFGNGADADDRLRTELLNDPKEIYEHALTVKLAYDELTTVCTPGSVAVNDLMSVHPRGRVQHLGSRVRGELAEQRTAWDALEAVFPAVTISGVPKAAAGEYIARTEQSPRGLYSGAVLMAAHDGTLDAGLVLRSVFEEDGRRWLRAGAGIVGSSRPDREYEETREKMRTIAPCLVEDVR